MPRPVGRKTCLLDDASVRIYVLLHMHPQNVQACRLAVERTLRMLQSF